MDWDHHQMGCVLLIGSRRPIARGERVCFESMTSNRRPILPNLYYTKGSFPPKKGLDLLLYVPNGQYAPTKCCSLTPAICPNRIRGLWTVSCATIVREQSFDRPSPTFRGTKTMTAPDNGAVRAPLTFLLRSPHVVHRAPFSLSFTSTLTYATPTVHQPTFTMPSTKRSTTDRESGTVRATKRVRLSSPTSSLKGNEFDDPLDSTTALPTSTKFRVVAPSPPSSQSASLKIKLPSTRTKRTSTIRDQPKPKKQGRTATYNMIPESRRAALVEMCPSIQFVHSTPFAAYCRACKEHHRLERRGKGWYADPWKRHIGRAAHKRRLAEWVQDGGDKIRQEDEPQKWKTETELSCYLTSGRAGHNMLGRALSLIGAARMT
ncbi:hypothetical protein NMY22_g15043 [Coprinellus aureogranulatus]|nr:hypothetical protein NMY22_g15043 [Coprinellus aureogranulatus]